MVLVKAIALNIQRKIQLCNLGPGNQLAAAQPSIKEYHLYNSALTRVEPCCASIKLVVPV